MADATPLIHRVTKNYKRLKKWAAREDLTAFRIYDRDIPEFPDAIDWYDGHLHWAEYPRRGSRRNFAPLTRKDERVRAVADALEVPLERVYVKTHAPKVWGQEQYERLDRGSPEFTVRERGLKFWVNLGDYLDTGLFLDHRETRTRVRAEAKGKHFLNLFAYTGSFTVHAAAGGAAQTVTVDLSQSYLDWAVRNLELNDLAHPRHRQVRADAIRWLKDAQSRPERYDLVVLDPPSFSTSKAMARRFEVQRDHPRLLADALALLRPGGVLYFSTNFLGFELQAEGLEARSLVELTPHSLPPDFRVRTLHRCWRLAR